jgi:hypothetical protein
MRSRCVACHRDVGWLAERGRGFHGSAPVREQRCASCHPDHAGLDFQMIQWPGGAPERFDHERAGWALDRSHAPVECETCHKAEYRVPQPGELAPGGRSRWTGLDPACATCHEDVHRGALGARCVSCHDAGRWTVTPGFDHDTTAYPLTGRHSEVACDQCHLAARLRPERDARGHPIPVYRPVPHQTCASCHRDVHEGRLGAECAACHTTRAFSEVTGAGFDHGRTRYPLRGKHASVRCASCHLTFATEAERKPPSATCTACHADPHAGRATIAGQAADCAACHVERGFTPSTFSLEQHQASSYPLEGRHATARCSGCHPKDRSPAGRAAWGDARVVMRPRSSACMDCHADEHGGQLRGRPGGGECATCHDLKGWKPSTFDSPAHAALRLALDGRHAAIECRACHGAQRAGLRPIPRRPDVGKAGFLFGVPEVECVACHLDPHGGRFEPGGARPADRGCLTCHDARAFSPSRVDVERHDRFRFELTGAHRATPCVACHGELAWVAGPRKPSSLIAGGGRFPALRFEAGLACADCHDNAHGSQFDGRPDRRTCDVCHGDDAFVPASRFDHDRDAALPLEGAHRPLACTACHRKDPVAGGTAGTVFRPLSPKCESCHG